MKKLQIIFLLTLSLNSFSQKIYYKINGGKPVDEIKYTQAKESIYKKGKLEELLLKTKKTEDSIIHFVRLGALSTTPDGFDPYAETKKYIGTRFQIEKFVNEKQKNFDKNFLSGKPTFINFWFTRCPPCIEEIPLLNELKEKFKGKANFITISFNDKKTIDEFTKQQPFNFQHIADSKKQIDGLNISAFPTSLILDKNGIIKFVFGEVTGETQDIEVIFEGLL
ncbi:TlpA family protein disulfide reductase [Chryseobacterium luquanense]|uniref:TlpA family protein disulfide reductase n=1 Tax=Chryseobacterium luquanense TaxID=2983766 RepID=A0ABT3XZK6_9FLAO|nr:TlpA disulfide reductase family protein [Chryseobacterium luquanense]MCX8531305.1 TlpA family protein disulfide reductase [Chryseobacterium luquanense]